MKVGTAVVQQRLTTSESMNKLGPTNGSPPTLARKWDVTETVWASRDAKLKANKFLAESKTVGSFLEERNSPHPGSGMPDFRRIYFLSFNRDQRANPNENDPTVDTNYLMCEFKRFIVIFDFLKCFEFEIL